MSPKTKMKVSVAVADYIKMFPEEYQKFLSMMQHLKGNLSDEMAAIKDADAIQRHLFEMPEKLSIMIGKKLEEEELQEFQSDEATSWFGKEFPQFTVTKYI